MLRPAADENFTKRLIGAVGAANVLTGGAVAGFATDVYRSRELPLAVVRPASVEALQAAVRTAEAPPTPTAICRRGPIRY